MNILRPSAILESMGGSTSGSGRHLGHSLPVRLSFALLLLSVAVVSGQEPWIEGCFGGASNSSTKYRPFSLAIDRRGDVFVTRFSLSGELQATLFPATSWGSNSHSWFTVPSGDPNPTAVVEAVAGDLGPYTAIWWSTGSVSARSFDASGVPLSDDVTVVTNPTNRFQAAAYPDGSYIVVVEEADESARGYRFSALGVPIEPPRTLIDQVVSVAGVVVAADGGIVVAARIGIGLVAYRFAPDLTPIDGPIPTTASGSLNETGISADLDQGRFLVRWANRTDFEIHGDVFDDQGAYQGSLARTSRGYWPEVSSATFSDGTFVVATDDWYETVGSGPITLQRHDGRGLPLGRMKTIDISGENSVDNARLASSPGGTVLAYTYAHYDYYQFDYHVDRAGYKVCRLKVPASPYSRLVSYWPFDGDAGGLAVSDRVGSHDGLLVADDPGASWGEGLFGDGLLLDGTSSQVEIGEVNELSGAGAMSVAGWVNLPDAGGGVPALRTQVLVSGGGTASVELFTLLARTTEGGSRARVVLEGTGGTTTLTVTAGSSLTPDEWHHVAMTYDFADGALTLYVDGEVAGSATDPERRALTSEAPWLRVGASSSGDGWLEGALDDVAVWRKALRPGEIQSVWNSGFFRPLSAFDELFADQFEGGDTESWPFESGSLADQFNLLLLSRGIDAVYATATFNDTPEPTYSYLGQSFTAASGALDGGPIGDLEELYWKNEDLASTIAPYAGEDPDGDAVPSTDDADAFDPSVQ